MSSTIEVIDLFAGPGGLGEGFAAAGRETTSPMTIRRSVEKDPYAIQTLRLRAFLRSFEGGFPASYYNALNSSRPLPDWDSLHPANWKHACEEAQQLELGSPGVFDRLSTALDNARERCAGRTILIGGPPCQAYSLAGRSRNAGNRDYVAESDNRHFLYREYVSILDRLRPAVSDASRVSWLRRRTGTLAVDLRMLIFHSASAVFGMSRRILARRCASSRVQRRPRSPSPAGRRARCGQRTHLTRAGFSGNAEPSRLHT